MPGSGKSTLATALSDMFGVRLINAGNVARDQAKTDPEVAAALASGQFAPKEKMNAAMKLLITKAVLGGETIVLEGYPRYKEQLDDLLAVAGDRVYFVRLDCNDGVATGRMLNRKRGDDKPDIIERRLLEFWIDTYPIFTRLTSVVSIPIGTQLDALNGAINHLVAQGALKWNSQEAVLQESQSPISQ